MPQLGVVFLFASSRLIQTYALARYTQATSPYTRGNSHLNAKP